MFLRSLFTGITRLSLNFKWITIALTTIALVFGVAAATQLNQELLPRVEFPQAIVVAIRPSARGEDLVDLVTKPLEAEVVKIKGVLPAGLESTTQNGVVLLTVRYDYGLNTTALLGQIKVAIDKVAAEGVPYGLSTTADLTPEIIRSVLTKAPSMWAHFNQTHLVGMTDEVLQAAFAVNPDFEKNLDQFTRDQLAARAVAERLTGKKVAPVPTNLPGAWKVTEPVKDVTVKQPQQTNSQPQIISFSLSDLPVLSASITGPKAVTSEAELAAFKALLDEKLKKELETNVPGIASVRITGGQWIPDDVVKAADEAIKNAATTGNGTNSGGTTSQPASGNTSGSGSGGNGGNQPAQTDPATLALPISWIANPIMNSLLRGNLNNSGIIVTDLRKIGDLATAKDKSGNPVPPSQVLNKITEITAPLLADGKLLPDLTGEMVAYLKTQQSDLLEKLDMATLEQIAGSMLRNGAWNQLSDQSTFVESGVSGLSDLAKIAPDGKIANLINLIATDLVTTQPSFSTRLIDSLTPEALYYVEKLQAGTLKALDPRALALMSPGTLASLPADLMSGLDSAVRDELVAIRDGKKPSAASAYATNTTKVVDENAPLVPESWTEGMKNFGLTVRTAADLLNKPFGQSAAGFLNLAANQPRSGIGALSAEVFLYLGEKDPNFWVELSDKTISQINKEVLTKLPSEIQARASGFIPTTYVTRANGNGSLLISVNKEATANTVAVSHAIDKVFEKFQEENPGYQVTRSFAQAPFIEESIEGVAREGALGAVGAVVVILFFLNFSIRSTLVTAVSIPTSVAIALLMMRWIPDAAHSFLVSATPQPGAPLEFLHTFLMRLFPGSITLNIMTLSGLTVAIGRVVDDSIVVLENIYRQLQKGVKPYEAALQGTKEVSVAIFAATLTTVVVFLPIGLTGGLVGEFFLPFGLAVSYSLVASFVVAITIVPVLAFMFISQKNLKEEKEGGLEHAYQGVLNWSLNNRLAVLIIATVTFVIGILLFASRPTTFLPQLGEPQISISVRMPSGTPLSQTDARIRQMEAALKTEREANKGVLRYQTTIGSGGGIEEFFGGGGTVEGNRAQITIAVDVIGEKLNTLTQDIRTHAETIFGNREYVKVSKATLSEQGFGGFAVVVTGSDASLAALNPQIKETLSKIPGLTNITSSFDQTGASRVYRRVGRQTAAQYGAELEAADTLGLTRKAISEVRKLPNLPQDVTVGEGFQSQVQTQGFSQTFGAMGIAIAIVYVVMVLTFGSLIHPFTILFTLPLAVVGAAAGLWITNRVLGLSALVGMLMLIGIVVTNAIVMLDRVQHNRKDRKMPWREALTEGARTRLRPILMTAIATIVALFPLAAGFSKGAIIATELGTVVIGGLFSSTVLTLLVVPVVYSMFDGLQRRIFRRAERASTQATSAADR